MRLVASAVALLGANLVLGAYAASVKLVNPPTEVKLNDRKHPIVVQYEGVNGEADIHVDLLADNNRWMGGGQLRVTQNAGVAKVPIEVRASPDFNGQMVLRSYLTGPGQNYNGGKLADAPEQYVRVSKTPTDAIGVVCQPQQVAPGQGFTLSLWFTQTHARESDIIVVALHADSKQYFGGFTVPISQMRGQVSGHFQLNPGSPNLPLKFKAWISPRGEEAPNYVSYTMIEMPLGYNVINDCPNLGTQQYNTGGNADWLELKNVPNTLARGGNANIGIEYNLVTGQEAEMELSLMSWNWRTHEANQISSTKQVLTGGHNRLTVPLPIPANAQPGPDGLYVVAFFTAPGMGYDDALAEDRKYKVYLQDGWSNQASDADETRPRPGLRVGAQPTTVEVAPNGEAAGGMGRAVANAFRRFWGGNANANSPAAAAGTYFENIELE